MDCQADEITERAAQRALARQAKTDAERNKAQQQLEADTKAQFEAIQRAAANPPKQ